MISGPPFKYDLAYRELRHHSKFLMGLDTSSVERKSDQRNTPHLDLGYSVDELAKTE